MDKLTEDADGNPVLLPANTLATTLASTEADDRARDAELTAQRMAELDAKRASLASGDAVPDDKRPV